MMSSFWPKWKIFEALDFILICLCLLRVLYEQVRVFLISAPPPYSCIFISSAMCICERDQDNWFCNSSLHFVSKDGGQDGFRGNERYLWMEHEHALSNTKRSDSCLALQMTLRTKSVWRLFTFNTSSILAHHIFANLTRCFHYFHFYDHLFF